MILGIFETIKIIYTDIYGYVRILDTKKDTVF